MKKRTSVYIDAELLEYARQNKINLSQLLEKSLKSLQNPKITGNTRACRALAPGSNPGRRMLFGFVLRRLLI
ncbi:type II toxin-antitoxin system CcdA family antitoxin [Archaeoglobus sulfaticallidus]|uniref:type II toxin-antitoxin system CcdA family antitoxin n=1 Tax=Archaeoglobus sulfaticallidus TaxID=1316941 RepID=UPI00064E57FB